MTRDRQRDLEALEGGIIVSWYCNLCNRSIPIEDENRFEEFRWAHLTRHRQGEPGS